MSAPVRDSAPRSTRPGPTPSQAIDEAVRLAFDAVGVLRQRTMLLDDAGTRVATDHMDAFLRDIVPRVETARFAVERLPALIAELRGLVAAVDRCPLPPDDGAGGASRRRAPEARR